VISWHLTFRYLACTLQHEIGSGEPAKGDSLIPRYHTSSSCKELLNNFLDVYEYPRHICDLLLRSLVVHTYSRSNHVIQIENSEVFGANIKWRSLIGWLLADINKSVTWSLSTTACTVYSILHGCLSSIHAQCHSQPPPTDGQ
jgi:hypothetical protein